MATDIWSIPRDSSSGAILGSYFLRHSVPDLNAVIGAVPFENGRSTRSVTGQELVRMAMAVGTDITLEPADDAARAAMGTSAPAPAPVAAPVAEPTPEPEPEAPAEVEPTVVTVEALDDMQAETAAALEGAADDLDAIEDLAALRKIAADEGVEIDKRWKQDRLRQEIRDARG